MQQWANSRRGEERGHEGRRRGRQLQADRVHGRTGNDVARPRRLHRRRRSMHQRHLRRQRPGPRSRERWERLRTTGTTLLQRRLRRVHNSGSVPAEHQSCKPTSCFEGVCGFADEPDGVSCANSNACKSQGVCTGGTCVQKDKSDGTWCGLGGTCASGDCCFGSVCSGECCGTANYLGCNGAHKCNL